LNDDFTSLKQLIVDLQNQDYSEYSEENRNLATNPKPWQEFYPTSKISRFKDSFDNFFEQIKFDKVVDNSGEKSILFTKNGNSISIDSLSTGEKQIVFRGIYLLKNNKMLEGSIIMIDEPEISMHPKWQQRILKYYKDLFFHNGNQIVQLFFATHSDHVVKDALSDNATTIVLTLEENGTNIKCRKNDCPSVLPSVTSAEVNFLAFDIISNDYHIELFGWLQEKESRDKIKSCDNYIIAQPSYNNAIHRKPSSFGNNNYESLCTYIRNAIHHPNPGNTFSNEELRISIELLIELCR
jgi:AAA domain, putative AbiEii toxin, Type IV TA system